LLHQELDDVHLLPRELVPDGGARGVAVGPRAAVDQVHGAALGRGPVAVVVAAVAVGVAVAVVQAAVPAVEGPRQRRALHLHVHPVAARQADTRGRCQLAVSATTQTHATLRSGEATGAA